MDIVQRLMLNRTKMKKFPQFAPGDTVDVHAVVKEGEKSRVQVFTGVVLKIQGRGTTRSFTVRKISAGVGVERTFPFASPAVDKVEVVSHGKARRARLHYLRGLKGRAARLTMERVADEVGTTGEEGSPAAAASAPKAKKEAAPKKK
ncbi:MAG: 50S ribosomal protein L19 [Bdellovibrionales bacterium]|nr:50S ribosomal protein L19 [Bdellovibrionales bacterium]